MTESKKYVPFVPSESNLPEFTIRALLIGLVMSVVLGAANAYLGLKAGMTIAATYPAAVIGMAILRLMKGNILEENFARTVGSIGESIAAGAIFTLPAFYIAGIWNPFYTTTNFWVSVAIMISGGVLGIMFVALLRRVLVEDVELPFPESVAAAEIHKAGQRGGTGSQLLFTAMGVGALIKALGMLKLYATSFRHLFSIGQGKILFISPDVKPAYMGVGYIIGPKLAALNFSGGLIAWGLLTPIIAYFKYQNVEIPVDFNWMEAMTQVWKDFVRPIAIGGMLVGAGFTLFRMRKSLATGISRSVRDIKKATAGAQTTERVEKDINIKYVALITLVTAIAILLIYNFFTNDFISALVATLVLIVAGFFFSAVSGYLVGIIGSSNNPVSGLTISTLVIAAILMVALGMTGTPGVAAVLGVASVICVTAAVAGEMFQDLKAGHILGGTPWKMQTGNIIGAIVSSLVMFLPLLILHEGDIKMGGKGFGGENIPAPQASLMAILSKGIVAGEMQWILIVVGMLMGFGFILMNVRSPMLVSVGMYLPLGTTFAIFVGGLIKGLVEKIGEKRAFNEAQKTRVENSGILLAAGLIAGEALIGLLFAGFAFYDVKLFSIFEKPGFLISLFVFVLIGWYLISIPIKHAGKPDEPAPPSAMM